MEYNLIRRCIIITCAMILLTGCNKSPDATAENELMSTPLENPNVVNEEDRKIIHLDCGDVLADEEDNYISNIYDEIYENDVAEKFPYIRYVQDGRIGYLSSKNGEIYIQAQYASASHWDKTIVVGNKKSKWLIDENANKISDNFEDAYEYELLGFYVRIKKDGKWGIMDTTGEIMVPCEYEKINKISEVHAYTSAMKHGEAYLLFTEIEGDHLIWKAKKIGNYSDIGALAEGIFFNVKDKNGNTGLIGHYGKVLIKPQYKEIYVKKPDFKEEIFLITAKEFDGTNKLWIYEKKEDYLYEVREDVV